MNTPSLSSDQLLAALNWRYATKTFDSAKKIPAAVWSTLEEALVLSPSSFGLQPWKFIVITDPAVKAKLVPASWNQTQPADCSHFVVFAVKKNIGADHVEKFLQRTVEVRGGTRESLNGYAQVINGSLEGAAKAGRLDTWQAHQLYIALGQFMAAAALIGVDTCPMEGIDPAQYDDILGLKGSGYATVVAAAAGYRAPSDKYATAKKVRFAHSDVITHV